MQYPFSCLPNTYAAIESALSQPRLARYLPAAGGDRHLALRLYIWNARICEALYLPFQFAEVVARNAIHIPVLKRFKGQWFESENFKNILSSHWREELNTVVNAERKRLTRKGVNPVTYNHIVAALPLGFWVALMGSAYDKHLWANGVRFSFPNSTAGEDRKSILDRLDALKTYRNRIAHHHPVFDRTPQAAFQNALHITNLVCTETHWLSNHISQLSRVINERPR